MSKDSINTSAQFYGTAIGRVNAQIIGNSCAAMNLEILKKHGRYDSAVFMGLGDGSLLEQIGSRFQRLVVLEASDELVAQARIRFATLPGVEIINSYFEHYQPAEGCRFSCILGNHVLEHLDDPVGVLRRSLDWLEPDGIAIFTVPSATSLHRRIGVQMGMLNHPADLSDQDRVVGHQRVYDGDGLQSDVIAAGYQVIETGGFNLKLVSQAQMVGWPQSLHDAVYHISRECPADLCSNLFVVCRRR